MHSSMTDAEQVRLATSADREAQRCRTAPRTSTSSIHCRDYNNHVDDTAESWSAYFNVHSPEGTMLVATGYGNNPQHRSALATRRSRLWTAATGISTGPAVPPADRGDLCAGPMRWTCVEPLRHWKLSSSE